MAPMPIAIRTILHQVAACALLAFASCSDRTPDASPAPVTQSNVDADAADDEGPGVAAPVAEEKLRADLSPMFRLIGDGQTGPARVRIRKYLALHPGDGQAAFLFGLSYHREKRYAAARPYFEQACAASPAFQPAPYFLGWCCYWLGDPDASAAAFSRHLELRPNEGDTHFGLGLIALDENRLDDAETRFRRAIALHEGIEGRNKDLSKAATQLAAVLDRRTDLVGARRELERAVALFPDHYESFYRLSRVYRRLGDEEAAAIAHDAFLSVRERLHPGTRFPE